MCSVCPVDVDICSTMTRVLHIQVLCIWCFQCTHPSCTDICGSDFNIGGLSSRRRSNEFNRGGCRSGAPAAPPEWAGARRLSYLMLFLECVKILLCGLRFMPRQDIVIFVDGASQNVVSACATHCLCFSPMAVPVFLSGSLTPPGPCTGSTFSVPVPLQHLLGVPLVLVPVMVFLWRIVWLLQLRVIWGLCPWCSLAKARLTLVYSFLSRVLQLAIGSCFFRYKAWNNA